jgi:hypothetical protein
MTTNREIEGKLHLECPIKCGYCCTHFILGPVHCMLPDDEVRGKMRWISNHGPEDMITCRRTVDGFEIKLDIPCRHYDKESKLCKVWGTSEQPDNRKAHLCDKARNRLAVEDYKKNKSLRVKGREVE